MNNNNNNFNFCGNLDIQLDIFDFFNRCQLLRLSSVNRQFNRLIEEHYPSKPFIYAQLNFLRHFAPSDENCYVPYNEPWLGPHKFVPTNKVSKWEFYFGGFYIFHLTALNCCCEQNVKQMLGGEPLFCHKILIQENEKDAGENEAATLEEDNNEEQCWKLARPCGTPSVLHKNCCRSEWTRMTRLEVENSFLIKWLGGGIREENAIYWKHKVHDEHTRNWMAHEFFDLHRNSVLDSLRYQENNSKNKRLCPALELLTNDFAVVQQHLEHPFVLLLKLDLRKIASYPSPGTISVLKFSTDLFSNISSKNGAVEQNFEFYRAKFANDLCWLFEHQRIHSASCIDLDISLLLLLIIGSNNVDERTTPTTSIMQRIVDGLGRCAQLNLRFGNCYFNANVTTTIADLDSIFNPSLTRIICGPLCLKISFYDVNESQKIELTEKFIQNYNPTHNPHRLLAFDTWASADGVDVSVLIDNFQRATLPCTYFVYMDLIICIKQDNDGHAASEHSYLNRTTNEYLYISPTTRYSLHLAKDAQPCFVTRGDLANLECEAEARLLHSKLRSDVAIRLANYRRKFPDVRLETVHIDHQWGFRECAWSWFGWPALFKEQQGQNIVNSIGPFMRHIFPTNAHKFHGEMYNELEVDLDSIITPP